MTSAVYLVRGEDPTLRADAVATLLAELVGDDDPSLVVEEHEPNADQPDTTAIAEAARTPPFLAPRRVVVVRDIGAYAADGLGPLISYLAEPEPTNVVVLVGGDRGRTSSALIKAVKSGGEIIEAGVPRDRRGRGKWMGDHLRGAPVKLDSEAIAILETHLGENLGRVPTLLDALSSAFGVGGKVGASELRPFLGAAGEVAPWALTDAIDRGDTPGALDALSRLLGAGDRHALAVMASLHTHYSRILGLDGADVVDEQGAAALLGMTGSTYPAKKALAQARRLGSEAVAEAIRLLAEADLDLRGTTKDWPDTLVLEVLVARLCRVSPGRVRKPGRPGAG